MKKTDDDSSTPLLLSSGVPLKSLASEPLPKKARTKRVEGASIKLIGASVEDFNRRNRYPLSRLRTWMQWVTPKLAAEWLDARAANRSVRLRRVEAISRDVGTGKYVVTGSTIVFDEKFRVIDGQHRLESCVASGEGFFTMCVSGVNGIEAMKNIDSGSSKSIGDRFKINLGCQNYNSAASVSLLLCQFNSNDGSGTRRNSTYDEAEAMYLKNRNDIDWVISNIGARIEPGNSSGGAPILAAFAFVRSLNQTLIDQAAVMFKSGEAPGDDHPMRKLRAALTLPVQNGHRIGNKSTSSQASRYQLSLVALGYLERLLIGSRKRGRPDPELDVITRLAAMRVNGTLKKIRR